MDEALQRALLASKSLPTIPNIAAAILDAVREDCGLGELVPLVSNDPALAARLIRYANSPSYARAQPISSIKLAVMQLGLDTTVIVALGFTLVDALRPATSGSLNYERFWRRSLLAAAAARSIARTFGIARSEEAFLAALLQDIGMMAIDRAGLGVYDGFLERQADHLMLSVVERGRARTSHPEVGAWLLARWRFPPDICSAVGGSHAWSVLTRSSSEPTFPWCVAYSGVLADAVLAQDPLDLSEALAGADRYGSFAAGWPDVVLEQMGDAVGEVEKLFEVTLIPNLMELMNASKELLTDRQMTTRSRTR